MKSRQDSAPFPKLIVPRAEAAARIRAELQKWQVLSGQVIRTREDFEDADAKKSKLWKYTRAVLRNLSDSDRIANEFGGILGKMRSEYEPVEDLVEDFGGTCSLNIHDLESILERLEFFPQAEETQPDERAIGNLEFTMGFDAKVLNVLIASPSDVSAERDAVEKAILTWNAEHGDHEKVMLQPRRWEIDTRPDMTVPPQTAVNKQLVDKCDLLLGIFWTRLGTPTQDFDSGTVEEINRFLNTGRPVMLYFSDKPKPPSTVDQRQYERLRGFRSDVQKKGLIEDFHDAAELMDKVERHLTKWIRELRRSAAMRAPQPYREQETTDDDSIPDLRPEAEQILMAANDPASGGKVYHKKHTGGLIVQVGKQKFEAHDGREQAVLVEAIRQLVALGLLDQKSDALYEVTHRGYLVIDSIIEARKVIPDA